jgi:hemolysin activation/secretion protein
MRSTRGLGLLATLLCVAAVLQFSAIAKAGSARDYLNAPIGSWLTTYNAGYSASVTPEDGTNISASTRSNVFALNYELVVAKPSGEPDSQTARLTIRQLW